MPQLIATLPDRPLAVIGDVHGELAALERLLARPALGPDRFLVFVGDLIDRGPDSPGVVRRVRELVDAGRAQVVLGNHELNLLIDRDREGNGWFKNREDLWQHRQDGGFVNVAFDSTPAGGPAERAAMLDFFASLPLAAENDELRVVHACWHGPSLAALPAEGDVATLMMERDLAIQEELEEAGVVARAAVQRAAWAEFKDRSLCPDRMLEDVAIQDMTEQNGNPVAALTSGLEERIPFADRFYIGGKWRFVERSRWWRDYTDPQAVVVGHYWRRLTQVGHGSRDVFQTAKPTDWAGPRRNVFCVDYSVGRRYRERAAGRTSGFDGVLGAVLWPERTLVFSDRPGQAPTR